MDRAAQRHARAHSKPDGLIVDDWERTWMAQTHGTDGCVRGAPCVVGQAQNIFVAVFSWQ